MGGDGRDHKGTIGVELGLKAAFTVEYLSVKDARLRRLLGAKGAVPPLVKWLESPGYQVCPRASVPLGVWQANTVLLDARRRQHLPYEGVRRVAWRQQLEMHTSAAVLDC
jgi:hypothetical protein